jgi:hypothetical protein
MLLGGPQGTLEETSGSGLRNMACVVLRKRNQGYFTMYYFLLPGNVIGIAKTVDSFSFKKLLTFHFILQVPFQESSSRNCCRTFMSSVILLALELGQGATILYGDQVYAKSVTNILLRYSVI